MATPPCLYSVRIRGRLGATALSAFPSMVSELKGSETVLTGLIEDRSALFSVVAQIEALGLELLELRQIRDGGRGPDRLTGGQGADRFVGGAGKDPATDFSPADGDTRDGSVP